jgi:serine/threonine protein kinase
MGQVWLGRKAMVGGATKTFAIKLLAPRHVASTRHRAMFFDEARLSMSLDHSNIVKVHEVDERDGVVYMAMEWLDGLTLTQLNAAHRLRNKPIPPVITAFVIAQVLRALDYAHEVDHRGTRAAIVHRDISPQNVMLTVNGEVKLLDFGIARTISDETSGLYLKGKPRYMPPEQFFGFSRGPAIDLFAVGALLHELLDGGRVFRGEASDERLIDMVRGGLVPDLHARKVPPELDALRRELLASEPERIASARLALTRLQGWSGYRDAGIELQTLVRSLVPSEGPAGNSVELGDTLEAVESIESILARLSDDESEASSSEHNLLEPLPQRVATERLPRPEPEPIAGDFVLDEELSTAVRERNPGSPSASTTSPSGSASKTPPKPPPPPKLPERELEIDWMAVEPPKTGPNPVVPQDTGSGSRGLVLVLVVGLVLAAALAAYFTL